MTTTPEDLITPNHDFMMRNKRHGTLAPKVAEDRWQSLQAVVREMERLSDLYYQRAEAAEDVRLEARNAHARAASTGKAAPTGTAVKVMEAELAVDGTLSALRAMLPRLESARKAYDALFTDRAFIEQYRNALIPEFLQRRETVLSAFAELENNVPALAELYQLIGVYTLRDLLGENHTRYMPANHGWSAPALAEALSTIRGFVDDPSGIRAGTLLAEPLGTIEAELPALAEAREEEADLENQRGKMQMRNANPW
ncbi:hypothetical protein ACWDUE_13975 [Streptomyces albogriseolus]